MYFYSITFNQFISCIVLFLLFFVSVELKAQSTVEQGYPYYTISDTIYTFDADTYTETVQVVSTKIYETAEVMPIWGDCRDLNETKRAGCSESQIDFHLMIGVQQFYAAFPDEIEEGTVWIKFYVDKEGMPNMVETNSALAPHFETKAIELITQMSKWLPGKIKGEKVNVALSIPIRFQRIIQKK